MKRFIIMMLLAGQVQAGAVFSANNDGGGQLLLTDEACPSNADWHFAYVKMKGGKVQFTGCWTYLPDDDEVAVKYSDGDLFTYSLGSFVLTPYGERKHGPMAQQPDPQL